MANVTSSDSHMTVDPCQTDSHCQLRGPGTAAGSGPAARSAAGLGLRARRRRRLIPGTRAAVAGPAMPRDVANLAKRCSFRQMPLISWILLVLLNVQKYSGKSNNFANSANLTNFVNSAQKTVTRGPVTAGRGAYERRKQRPRT